MDWEDEEEFPGRPFGPKPFGPKPFGPKPFGPKPFGPKQFGTRPFGPKPFGPKPFGPKPFGPKASGADEADGGFLDLDEWSAEIADLVCGRSAVIRLGATLVAGEQGAALPVVDFQVNEGFRSPGKPEPDPGDVIGDDLLRPGEWDLSAGVTVSQRVRAALASSPDLGYALKAQLADALARRVDTTVLQGIGDERTGIIKAEPSREDPLKTARAMLTEVRKNGCPFRNPGWVFDPNALDELTRLVTADGLSAVEEGVGARTLDSYELLQLDGIDGGVFLGFPFVLSAGAEPNIYFAADWQEAWIGVAAQFVSVTTQPASGDAIVFRAALPFDFAVGNTAGFVGRGPDDGSERTPSPME